MESAVAVILIVFTAIPTGEVAAIVSARKVVTDIIIVKVVDVVAVITSTSPAIVDIVIFTHNNSLPTINSCDWCINLTVQCF